MLQPPPPLPQETNGAARLVPLGPVCAARLGQRVYQSPAAGDPVGQLPPRRDPAQARDLRRAWASRAARCRMRWRGWRPRGWSMWCRRRARSWRGSRWTRSAKAPFCARRSSCMPSSWWPRRSPTSRCSFCAATCGHQAAAGRTATFAGFYQADAALHRLILSFTGFRELAQVADTAWLHVNRARQMILPVPGRVGADAGGAPRHRRRAGGARCRQPRAQRRKRIWRQLIRYLEPLERDRPELFEKPEMRPR